MMFRLILAVMILAAPLGTGTPASARQATAVPIPPAGFTWFVLKTLNSFYDNTEDPTDRPELITEVPAGMLKPVDINHDGNTDWLIEWPESAQFCGTGGCARSLYISRTDADGQGGFTRALDRQTLDLKIGEVAGETRIEAWVHHIYCDETREECRFAWAWDDTARRLVQRPAGDGITILDGAGPETVDVDIGADHGELDVWPVALGNAWQESRVVCLAPERSEGYSVAHADIVTIPDVNGDGRPDWVVSRAYPCSGEDQGSPFAVWTTTGEGDDPDGIEVAYEAPVGAAMGLDLAGPSVLIAPGCATDDEGTTRCDHVPLHWDARTRKLVRPS